MTCVRIQALTPWSDWDLLHIAILRNRPGTRLNVNLSESEISVLWAVGERGRRARAGARGVGQDEQGPQRHCRARRAADPRGACSGPYDIMHGYT